MQISLFPIKTQTQSLFAYCFYAFGLFLWLNFAKLASANEELVYRYEFNPPAKPILYCDLSIPSSKGPKTFRTESVQPFFSNVPNLNLSGVCRFQEEEAFVYLIPAKVVAVEKSTLLISGFANLNLNEEQYLLVDPEAYRPVRSIEELEPKEAPVVPQDEVSEQDNQTNPVLESRTIPEAIPSYPSFRSGGTIGAAFYLGRESMQAAAGLTKYSGSNLIAGTKIDLAFCLNPQDACSASFEATGMMHTYRVAGENGKVDEPTAKSFRRVHMHQVFRYHVPLSDHYWISPAIGARVSQVPFFRSERNPDGESDMTNGWFFETMVGIRMSYLSKPTERKYDENGNAISFSSNSRWELSIFNLPNSIFGDASAKAQLFDLKYVWQRDCNEYLIGVSSHTQELEKSFECSGGTENCNTTSSSKLDRHAISIGIRQSI